MAQLNPNVRTGAPRPRVSLADAAERHAADDEGFRLRLGDAQRAAEAQRARDEQMREAGYRVGYRQGTHWGMVCGAICTLVIAGALYSVWQALVP